MFVLLCFAGFGCAGPLYVTSLLKAKLLGLESHVVECSLG